MAKCSFHADKEAVEKCTICGKDMCADCAPKYVNERVACPVCLKDSLKQERRGYIWILPLIGLAIAAAIAVITLLVIMIVRDGNKDLTRNILVMVATAAIMGFAIFMLIKSIDSLKYYNKRYKVALNYEKTAETTTEAEPVKVEETKATTTAKKASTTKKANASATTTAAVKKPTTAKKVATKTAATTAKTSTKATTAKSAAAKTTTSKKETTTSKKEVKPVEKKTTTTVKKSTTAKKAAVKKSTTTK